MDFAGGRENPSGIHEEGREAKKRLEDARARVAKILKCQARDIVFTSGGSESNNLAILGVFEALRQAQGKAHVIIGESEHPSVVEPAREIERRGGELTITNDPLKHIGERTVLVSIAYANNETGAINNVPKLARRVRDQRRRSGTKFPLIHTDATSAYEHLPVDIDRVPADLISIDKVLVVRPNVEIRPLIFGGGQERGLRSGTEKVGEVEKFVRELELLEKVRERESKRLERIKKTFLTEVKAIPNVLINTPRNSLPNIVSLSFPGRLHEFLAVALDERGVAVSTGSSCDSSKSEPDKEALRFSFGEKTSEKDAKEATRILKEIVIK